VFTYVPTAALAQPSVALHASFVNSVPVAEGDMQPIERTASYHGVYWNAGPDLNQVLGVGAVDRLRLSEQGSGPPAFDATRTPIRDTREFTPAALQARTMRAVRVAQREFRSARSLRGAAPGNSAPSAAPASPTKPEVKSRPLRSPVRPDSAAVDTLRRARKGGAAGGSDDR
jgi:hypothetical protein